LGYNADYLQDALRRATVTYEAGNPRAALLMAAEMLATSEGAREIYLLSDFQATNFADLELALPDDITLVTVDVAHEVVGNQALGRVRVTPNPALVGETMRVECDVANYSDEPV